MTRYRPASRPVAELGRLVVGREGQDGAHVLGRLDHLERFARRQRGDVVVDDELPRVCHRLAVAGQSGREVGGMVRLDAVDDFFDSKPRRRLQQQPGRDPRGSGRAAPHRWRGSGRSSRSSKARRRTSSSNFSLPRANSSVASASCSLSHDAVLAQRLARRARCLLETRDLGVPGRQLTPSSRRRPPRRARAATRPTRARARSRGARASLCRGATSAPRCAAAPPRGVTRSPTGARPCGRLLREKTRKMPSPISSAAPARRSQTRWTSSSKIWRRVVYRASSRSNA